MIKNTIIFDVDGTLIDTRSGIILSVKHVINKFNLAKLPDEKLYEFVGISPLQTAFCHFCNIDKELAQKCSEEFRAYYNQKELFNANVYDKIIELLEFLKTNNYKLGIATYKREDLVLKLLKHFDLYKSFDIVFGADNNNKLTKSDMIEKCLQYFHAQKESTIMIGDSCHDAGAAQQLSVNFIGVTYGFGFKNENEVKQYNPILVAKNPTEILKYLEEC